MFQLFACNEWMDGFRIMIRLVDIPTKSERGYEYNTAQHSAVQCSSRDPATTRQDGGNTIRHEEMLWHIQRSSVVLYYVYSNCRWSFARDGAH